MELDPSGMTPISLTENERLKKLKKQERNRAAAKRCRDRKNEKLEKLEIEAECLRNKKSKLLEEQDLLKKELESLQTKYDNFPNQLYPTTNLPLQNI